MLNFKQVALEQNQHPFCKKTIEYENMTS